MVSILEPIVLSSSEESLWTYWDTWVHLMSHYELTEILEFIWGVIINLLRYLSSSEESLCITEILEFIWGVIMNLLRYLSSSEESLWTSRLDCWLKPSIFINCTLFNVAHNASCPLSKTDRNITQFSYKVISSVISLINMNRSELKVQVCSIYTVKPQYSQYIVSVHPFKLGQMDEQADSCIHIPTKQFVWGGVGVIITIIVNNKYVL